jgi:AcrR family transcriptional regulator
MKEPSPATSGADRPNTKQALLDAAEALFGERGYEAVGIREIVDRANANLAAIKYHFGSKRELYNETVRRVLERSRVGGNIWDLLGGPFAGPSPPAEASRALGAFVGLHCLRVLQGGPSSIAARLFLLEAIWPSEAFNDVIEEHFKPCMERLGRVIRVINPGISDPEAATLANSVMAPLAYQRIYRRIIDSMAPDGQPTEAHAIELSESIIAFVIRGIGGDAALLRAGVDASRDAIGAVGQRSGAGPVTENNAT